MIFKKRDYKKDFPIVDKHIYFDSACMSLRPYIVIEKQKEYYEKYSSCAGRSNHSLSINLDNEIRRVRLQVKKFLNAKSESQIIFTRNTTEGINIVANCYPFKRGDVILLSDKEHNSNLVPWQNVAKEKKLKLEFFEHGNLVDFSKKIVRTNFLATNITSNLDGKTQDVDKMLKEAKKNNVVVLLDAAQSVAHQTTDVRKLGVDFLVFSAHKMMGPTGLGVLYGKKELLEEMKPYNLGGETVIDTTYEKYELAPLPNKFEAGLQDYSAIYAFGGTINYINKIGFKTIKNNDETIYEILAKGLNEIDELVLLSTEPGNIVSFYVKNIDNHEVALQLSSSNIMVRSGYHCCHSWFNSKNIEGSIRASFYIYNTREDAETFLKELKRVLTILK
ncbi:MAG: aminotransferase class V-fold PLP-dependent enzyme [Candidatus Woesearchaeota archaeon]